MYIYIYHPASVHAMRDTGVPTSMNIQSIHIYTEHIYIYVYIHSTYGHVVCISVYAHVHI